MGASKLRSTCHRASKRLATVCRAKGPAVRQAQAKGLGILRLRLVVSAQRANSSVGRGEPLARWAEAGQRASTSPGDARG
jgi:hypothetical protein